MGHLEDLLIAVAALCALDPYTSFNKSWGWNTGGHFPTGPVFLLVVFTVGLNVLIKLVRKAWAFSRPELMLIWCMALVACAIPNEGLGSFWYGVVAGCSRV